MTDYRITSIDWDATPEEIRRARLPQTVDTLEAEDPDDIAEQLSKNFGFTVKGVTYLPGEPPRTVQFLMVVTDLDTGEVTAPFPPESEHRHAENRALDEIRRLILARPADDHEPWERAFLHHLDQGDDDMALTEADASLNLHGQSNQPRTHGVRVSVIEVPTTAT